MRTHFQLKLQLGAGGEGDGVRRGGARRRVVIGERRREGGGRGMLAGYVCGESVLVILRLEH